MVCCSLFLGSTKLTSSFFSFLRGSSCPFLPPSMELWAQLGSLQPGSQLQSAPFLQLHHLQLQSHLCFPAREPPIHSHQPRPWPSSVSPCSSATKGISGKETSAPPPQLPDPSTRLWLWAGAWARAQAGDRQPVHVALICGVKLLHHLGQTALTHAHIIQTPPIFMWVCETLRERIMLADSETWPNKSFVWSMRGRYTLTMSVLGVCLPMSDPHNLDHQCPQWMYFWEFYNSVDMMIILVLLVLCEKGRVTCVAVLEPRQKIFLKYFYYCEFKEVRLI